MKRLIEFYWDCGRGGCLDGRFVVDDSGWSRLQGLIESKQEIHFGEVLGKHSDVYGELESKDIKVLTEDQGWLAKAVELGIDLNSGFNPLDYYEEEEGEPEAEVGG